MYILKCLIELTMQGRARAAPRRKAARPGPGKGKGKVSAGARRPVSTARPETRGVVISSATEPLRRELRKRPAEKRLPEGPSQRRRREEEEREREEEESSGSDDSVSDPGYRLDPGELAAAREDPDDGDDDDFTDEDE
jgi:hypothetical protein